MVGFHYFFDLARRGVLEIEIDIAPSREQRLCGGNESQTIRPGLLGPKFLSRPDVEGGGSDALCRVSHTPISCVSLGRDSNRSAIRCEYQCSRDPRDPVLRERGADLDLANELAIRSVPKPDLCIVMCRSQYSAIGRECDLAGHWSPRFLKRANSLTGRAIEQFQEASAIRGGQQSAW